jgi:hypothetical protein
MDGSGGLARRCSFFFIVAAGLLPLKLIVRWAEGSVKSDRVKTDAAVTPSVESTPAK